MTKQFNYFFPNKIVVGETEMPKQAEYKIYNQDLSFKSPDEATYKHSLNKWLSTAKSYPIADSENKKAFLILAVNVTGKIEFDAELNQGILIPAENVEIRLSQNLNYFGVNPCGEVAHFIPITPLSTIEESTEGQDELKNFGLLKKLLAFQNKYEINIQFWPDQTAVYLSKDGVDLTDFGGDFNYAIEKALEYLNKINPKN